MSDDWKPGDLALCVRGGRGRLSAGKKNGRWCRESEQGYLRERATYVVRRVAYTDSGKPYIGLIEVPGPWLASRFRKIRPHTPDEEDAETIRLLNSAPARLPSPTAARATGGAVAPNKRSPAGFDRSFHNQTNTRKAV